MARRSARSTPRVYSYIRFSTPEQKMGDSERRQTDAARRWAERKKLPFDESLVDQGLSGYSGKHRKKGALGRFLARVEAGDIPRGSILVVENIDRLSREGVVSTLRDIMFKLWENDITLQTLSPEESYGPGCDSSPAFLALLIYMQRARDESEQKSLRIREARKASRMKAREQGRPITAQCPWWLKVENGKYLKIPAAARTIKRIFKMKADGLGTRSIEAALNAKAEWSPPPRKTEDREAGKDGNGWRASYIKKILGNRAVLGEYQPFEKQGERRVPVGDPIERYYPPVVDEALFHAVEKGLAANRGKGGQTGKASNLLVHLAKCGYCGGVMTYADKGKPPKGGRYLVCDNAKRRRGCSPRCMSYDECVEVLLENCHRLRPQDVLPKPEEQERECDALRSRLATKTAKIDTLTKKYARLMDTVSNMDDGVVRKDLVAQMEAVVIQREQLADGLRRDEDELRAAESGLESFKDWKVTLETLREALTEEAPEIRLRLRAHLRELIERVDVYATGYVRQGNCEDNLNALGLDFFAEALEDSLWDADRSFKPNGEFRQFQDFVSEKRLTRAARFIVVRFKTGAVIPLAPEGSIADGRRLVGSRQRGEWETTTPDLQRLWKQFKRHCYEQNGLRAI